MGRRSNKRAKIAALLTEAIDSHPDAEEIRELAATAPKNIRRVRCFGKGVYWCSETGHSWSSHRALFSVDIKKEKLQYIFGQRCGECEGPYKKPSFSTMELKRMVEHAVEFFLHKFTDEFMQRDRGDSKAQRKKPHKGELCEACEMGCCYQPVYQSDSDDDYVGSNRSS